MPIFRNRNYAGRDYECTNIVAAEAAEMPTVGWNGQPADYWVPATGRLLLEGLDLIGSFAGIRFYGYL
jgi:hypothetical protein